MKTERRQELKTNDLSVYLKQVSDYVGKHAALLTIGAAVVVAGVAAAVYANHATIRNRELGWQAYREALTASFVRDPENSDWVSDTIAQWQAVKAEYDDPAIESPATWKLAQFCLRQFVETDDADFRNRLLDVAEDNCRSLLERDSANTTILAAALSGLVAVEQNRYVLDGDDEHRERSRAYLERLRNDPAFLGSPFQADALKRLNEFDRLWQPLVLVDPPPAPEPPAEDQPSEDESQSSIEPAEAEEAISDTPAEEPEQATEKVGEDQPDSDTDTAAQPPESDPAASDEKPEQVQPSKPNEP